MSQTDSRTGTISTGLMWYILSPGPTSTILIVLFLRCSNVVAFQQHDETSGHYSSAAEAGLVIKYHTRPARMVPVWCLCANMCRRWRWSRVSLGHLSGRLERHPAATRRRLTVCIETQRPFRLIGSTVIPDTDTERNLSSTSWHREE